MVEQVRYLFDVGRFIAVDLAHELRRDYERGVFCRRTLATIGVATAVALISVGRGEWTMVLGAVFMAALFTYTPARADRRWRDERRDDP